MKNTFNYLPSNTISTALLKTHPNARCYSDMFWTTPAKTILLLVVGVLAGAAEGQTGPGYALSFNGASSFVNFRGSSRMLQRER